MANADKANGFKPVKTISGRPWTGTLKYVACADRSADTGNNYGDVYVGDPVKVTSGLALVANSGDAVDGVCVGVGNGSVQHGSLSDFDPDNLMNRYAPHADTTATIAICPAVDMVFSAQTNAALDLIEDQQADFSIDADEAHGSRTTSMSNAEIVTNSNSDLTVVGIGDQIDNDETAANAVHLVMFNNITRAQT